MEDKKTETITFRTDKDTKECLKEAAKQNKWTISQVCEEICKQFTINPQPGRIRIKTSELKKLYDELVNEKLEGCELDITFELNEEEQKVYRVIEITGLQCGGLGAISGFEPIYEMTEDEIKKLP